MKNMTAELALSLALNDRNIYGFTLLHTIENERGLDVVFSDKDNKIWSLTEEIDVEECRRLYNRAKAIQRKRMAWRATFLK